MFDLDIDWLHRNLEAEFIPKRGGKTITQLMLIVGQIEVGENHIVIVSPNHTYSKYIIHTLLYILEQREYKIINVQKNEYECLDKRILFLSKSIIEKQQLEFLESCGYLIYYNI